MQVSLKVKMILGQNNMSGATGVTVLKAFRRVVAFIKRNYGHTSGLSAMTISCNSPDN